MNTGNDGWMVDNLHHDTFRIAAVKTARTIPVCTGFRHDGNIISHKKAIPVIDLLRCGNKEADMVEPLYVIGSSWFHNSMQRQVVMTGSQVDVIFVRAPLNPHTQQVNIEAFAGGNVRDVQRHVTHAQ